MNGKQVRAAMMDVIRIFLKSVLSAKEAQEFVGMTPDRFFHWRKRWGVKPCAFGRYSIRSLLAGLQREARNEH